MSNVHQTGRRFLGPVMYLVIGTTAGVLGARGIDANANSERMEPAGSDTADGWRNAGATVVRGHGGSHKPGELWAPRRDDHSCEEQLEQTLAQLETLQESLAVDGAVAPAASDWTQDFDLNEISEDQEAAVRPLLEEALQGPDLDFHAECRGDVCRVEIVSEGEDAQDAFDLIVDAPNYGEVADTLKCGPPVPTTDPTTKKNTWLQTAWIKMQDGDRASGWDLLAEVFDGFMNYGPLDVECMDLAGTGVFVVMLSVDENGKLSASTGGGLASTPAGQCAVEKLDDYLAEHAGVTGPISSSTRTFKMEKQDG